MKKAEVIKDVPVITKDKKFLIVREEGQDFWKNVGGTRKKGEVPNKCLTRELKEEMNVEIVGKPKFYYQLPITYTVTEPKKSLDIYLYNIEYKGELKPSSEIVEMKWIGSKDVEKGDLNLAYQITDYIIPKLVEDGRIE
jgi:ADP-ribose pyrophosphatase YjhB (NUDIX family)